MFCEVNDIPPQLCFQVKGYYSELLKHRNQIVNTNSECVDAAVNPPYNNLPGIYMFIYIHIVLFLFLLACFWFFIVITINTSNSTVIIQYYKLFYKLQYSSTVFFFLLLSTVGCKRDGLKIAIVVYMLYYIYCTIS